jgi:hypothetical protein
MPPLPSSSCSRCSALRLHLPLHPTSTGGSRAISNTWRRVVQGAALGRWEAAVALLCSFRPPTSPTSGGATTPLPHHYRVSLPLPSPSPPLHPLDSTPSPPDRSAATFPASRLPCAYQRQAGHQRRPTRPSPIPLSIASRPRRPLHCRRGATIWTRDGYGHQAARGGANGRASSGWPDTKWHDGPGLVAQPVAGHDMARLESVPDWPNTKFSSHPGPGLGPGRASRMPIYTAATHIAGWLAAAAACGSLRPF